MPHIARSPLRSCTGYPGFAKKRIDYPLRIKSALRHGLEECPRTTCQPYFTIALFLCPKTSMPSNATANCRTGTGLHPVAHPITHSVACRRVTLAQPISPYVVLLHATSRDDKLWDETKWIALANSLPSKACSLFCPGAAAEKVRSERLTGAIPNAISPPRLNLVEAAALLGHAHRSSRGYGLEPSRCRAQRAYHRIYTATDPGLTACMPENWLSIWAANKNPQQLMSFVHLTQTAQACLIHELFTLHCCGCCCPIFFSTCCGEHANSRVPPAYRRTIWLLSIKQ